MNRDLIDYCFLPRLRALAKDAGLNPLSEGELARKAGLQQGDRASLNTVMSIAEELGFTATFGRFDWSTDDPVYAHSLMLFRDGSTAILEAVLGGTPLSVRIRQDQESTRSSFDPLVMTEDDLAPLWNGDLIILHPHNAYDQG